jgi:hypothetical protein
MHQHLPASLTLALALPLGALAATPAAPHPDTAANTSANTATEIQALRQELAALRSGYEARTNALEQRLQAAEAAAAAATVASAASPPPAAPAAPAPGGAVAAANGFNPAISLILSGLYQGSSQDPARYAITGFQLPTDAEVGPGSRGFSLAESELGLAANIDPWWRGAANISLHGDNTLSVEEAYVQTTALGNGLSLKGGRFFSGVGYLNSAHSHTWDFVDNPLAYQALLGTQYGDDGVQLHWLAPLDQYVELGLELGRGRSYPGSDSSRNGAGMWALTAHTGGDVGDSSSWRAGLSVLNAKASEQALQATNAAGDTVNISFSGRTRVLVADALWKWAPGGNATRTNFKLQGEYLQSTRTGDLTYDLDAVNSTAAMRAVQSGWYVQGIYQFMPAWRVGLRTERLDAGTPDYGVNTADLAGSGYRPSKNSLMLDFSASEFSRWRLQLAQDKARQGVTDKQVSLQYQMSLGAHGAHSY